MRFVKITSIKSAGKQHVYDLSMQDTEDPSFVANSFIVHNSYAAAEAAMSTFLETVNSYRTHLTNSIFHKKLFPLISIANRMFKDKTKQQSTDRIVDFLFNANNRANLKTPEIHWHKDLASRTESNLMEMLDKLQEKGVPIPIKMWLAAAGVDKSMLLRDAHEDAAIREALKHVKVPEQAADGDDVEDGNSELTSTSINSEFTPPRMGILQRDFGDSGDLFGLTPTGKKKWVHNQEAKKRDVNWNIAKTALKAETDPNYREELRKRNESKGVATRLHGF